MIVPLIHVSSLSVEKRDCAPEKKPKVLEMYGDVVVT